MKEVVKRILEARDDLTGEEVLRLIEEKKSKSGSLLTDEGAAYILASEFGVKLGGGAPFEMGVSIKDLAPGINDVSIAGRVLLVSPLQSFLRTDGTSGKLVKLVLADETGTITAIMWDENAELASRGEVAEGRIVKVSHGYVREGIDGSSELHVGRRGTITALPSAKGFRDSPKQDAFFKKIGELNVGDAYVNVVGSIAELLPERSFTRRNGTTGRLRRARLADETGTIVAVFWNDQADKLKEAEIGGFLKIIGGRVREGMDGDAEYHVESHCQVAFLEERPIDSGLPSTDYVKLADLKAGQGGINVLARVIHVGRIRGFERKDGRHGRLAHVALRDETGSCTLTLWDEHAESVNDMRTGDVILLQSAYTRERHGNLSLSLGRNGSIRLNPAAPGSEVLRTLSNGPVQIESIKPSHRLVSIKGVLASKPSLGEVVTRSGRSVRLATCFLRDETGEIRLSMWGELASAVEHMEPNTALRVNNLYVKAGLNGQVELSSGAATEIELSSDSEAPSTDYTFIFEQPNDERERPSSKGSYG